MKKKNLMYSALGLSIGLGIMYMGKAKITKNLIQNGNAQYNEQGQLVITEQGSKNSVKKDSTQNTSTKLFEYNNPNYHAPTSYWKTQTTGTFYLPLVDENGVEFDSVKIKIENDGKIAIPIGESIKSALKIVSQIPKPFLF